MGRRIRTQVQAASRKSELSHHTVKGVELGWGYSLDACLASMGLGLTPTMEKQQQKTKEAMVLTFAHSCPDFHIIFSPQL